MNKKLVPYLIGIPNLSVGLLWAMNMSLIPMLVGTVTTSNAKLGLLTGMGAFTGIFVQYLAGIISDRSNFKMGKRKPFVFLGAFFASIFIAVLPFSKTYAAMLLISFLFYFFLNFFQGPYYTLIPEVVEEGQLGLANGFSKIVSVLGSGVILLVGPTLWDINPVYPFLLACALGIISVLIGGLTVKENPECYSKPNKISLDFVKYPSVLKLFIAVFFVFLSYGCITPYFVKYCVTQLNFTANTASTGLFLLTIVSALFAVPAGMLSDRISRRVVFLAGTVIFAVGMFVAVFVKTVGMMYLALGIVGIGFICIQVTIYAIIANIAPPERLGEFMGIMNLFISLSQWIATSVMGYILDSVGFSYYFPIAAVLMCASTVIIVGSKYEKKTVEEVNA
ncbi:MFS transporter [Konateibacter massiliensis]|uniref:MFS transporter n=1 Tax=Konateibacter massiliensis TaxID=2002841 RepID=UPI000C15FA8A|nr:MFS transporter [Konateibacter massiliensis]